MIYKLFFVVLFCSNLVLGSSFTKGEGSKFNLLFSGAPKSELSIYVSSVSKKKINVEYYFKVGMGITQMWQQFEIILNGNKPVTIGNGYFITPELKKPEIMDKKFFSMNDGVEVNDFLFAKKDMAKGDFKGDEKVVIPAGEVKASKFVNKKNGQEITFWISEEAKPISLVKLVSKGKKVSQNYIIELQSLITKVKPTIDPSKAVPMSKKGRSLLMPKSLK